ncbi:YncE family protein [Lacticaseibacillus zhaodongensis]|uniref:YncE family protein n=1 Tax=Lacticaseibacillus zhaodongensis TaxID=2668065 RepID=UPI0012D310DC|nr:hypothetical protein [Lacticaseibacillus zhaodongensis]
MQHKKSWLPALVVVLLLLGGGWYWFAHSGSHAKTNTNAAVTTEKQFYQDITKKYPQLKPALDHDAKPDTYVIPGLLRTQTLRSSSNQLGVSKTMDPQGLTVTPQYVVISAYSHDKKYRSVLYFIDKHTGKFVKQIVMPTNSHAGGLAYDTVSKRIWVTTETASQTASLSAYDPSTWQQADFAKTHNASQFDHVISLRGVKRASFITYHNNSLDVGFFDQSAQGKFLAFPMTQSGLPDTNTARKVELRGANQVGKYTTSKRLQGATFYEGKLLFSQSFGRNSSNILAFDNDGQRSWIDFDKDDTLKTVKLPPYLEQITADGSDLYVLFESGAAKYRKANLVFHADRVVKFDLDRLLQ